MSDLIEDTNPRDLRELLGQIHAKEMALPDFQRDFVWDPKMTQELIVSIASQYPAGSLLRIRDSGSTFACREFQSAPPLGGTKPTYLVLDGQQRLTSLYQAFYGAGDHLYFVDLRVLLEGRDFDEAIFHLRAISKRAKELARPEVQESELVVPLSLLQKGTGDFYRWAGRASRKLPSELERSRFDDQLKEIADRWIEPIWNYQFPVVTLSQRTPGEAICAIFETLNRTGVKLSPFELLSAKFRPQNIQLRELWDKAIGAYPIIDDFTVDPYYALQVIALLARPSPSIKRGDVLKLEGSAVTTWWDKTILAFSRALEILRDDCGVFVPRWLPYNTITIPIAAVLAKSDVMGTTAEAGARLKLTRWFFCSVFGQTYENTPTGQSATDYRELIEWINGGKSPKSVSDFKFDYATLMDTTFRQRALYNGVVCLLLRSGPRDFHTGGKLTPEIVETAKIEDHHLFPRAYLERKGIADRAIECVLNKTLIDKRTNAKISDKAPSVYLSEISAGMPAGDFDNLMRTHHLPIQPDSPMMRDDYDAFLEWRKQAIEAEIRSVTA